MRQLLKSVVWGVAGWFRTARRYISGDSQLHTMLRYCQLKLDAWWVKL